MAYLKPEENMVTEQVDVMGYKMPIKRLEGCDHTFWSIVPKHVDSFQSHLDGIREADVRPDDIFICTYPRSGTNWTNEIVRMLMKDSDEYVSKHDFMDWLDALPRKALDEMSSPRIITTHLLPRFLPQKVKEKGRVICVFRNPKDVAVSYCHWIKSINIAEFDGSFSDFLKMFFNGDIPSGSWFKFVQAWENAIENKDLKNVHQMIYEDLQKDLRGNIERLSEFLGLKKNGELFDRIAHKCQFKNMLQEKRENVPKVIELFSKDQKDFLYRRGTVGDWKNWFTVAENELFDQIYKERMKNSKFDFTYSL